MKFSKKIIPTKTHVSSVWHQGMDFMSYYHAGMFRFVNYAQSRFLAKDQMLIVLLVEAQSLITRRYSFKFQNNNVNKRKYKFTQFLQYEVEFSKNSNFFISTSTPNLKMPTRALILGANCNEQELFNFRRYLT